MIRIYLFNMETLPKVSIIITHYKENNKRYLDLCVKSVMNLNYPKDKLEIIITSPKWNRPEYPGIINVSPDHDCHFAENLNFGISCANSESEYYLHLSDDTMVTKNSLLNMITTCYVLNNQVMVNATSNCDNHWYYL